MTVQQCVAVRLEDIASIPALRNNFGALTYIAPCRSEKNRCRGLCEPLGLDLK